MHPANEIISLFRKCLPFIVRADETAFRIISNPENHIITRRADDGALIAVSVVHKNCILLLCVDELYRRQGIGSALLSESETLIRSMGYAEAVVGAGDDYLAPGVPTGVMPAPQALRPARLYDGLTDHAAAFFRRRGYFHSWGDGNCFDMRVPLDELPPIENNIGDTIGGVTYRWATPSDIQAVCACTDDAYSDFTRYYNNPALYESASRERVLIAEADNLVCGALIVSLEAEAKGLGSVGCTAVRNACQGRRIAANMVCLGTKFLRKTGLMQAYLGYTYSGLDKLYGFAGYRICVYYLMAKKRL